MSASFWSVYDPVGTLVNIQETQVTPENVGGSRWNPPEFGNYRDHLR